MDLATLPVLTTLSNHVDIVEKNGIPIVRVRHDKANAGISLHGGHVTCFQPKGQANLIWMSEKTEFETSKALRGGIPICWPWFGRVATPAHGFARTSQWQLLDHSASEQGVRIILSLSDNESTRAIWPHRFSAHLYIDIGNSLKVALNVENTDSQTWKCSGALHTYLTVGDIRQVEVTGMGYRYLDGLQQGKHCENETKTLTFNAPIDRVYTEANSQLVIQDPTLNHTVTVENGGQNAAVIWNPWLEGAQSMGDMADNGYLTMLCIESTYHATSQEAGIQIKPGEHFMLSTMITANTQ